MVTIKGIQKTSIIDYPNKICTILFTPGCNFKCPFCYNRALVLDHKGLPEIPQEEILEFLESRKKWIDGVCITGGEPLLFEDIASFIAKVKKIGLLVKIDTNGTNPELLSKLIDAKLVDYIAMDIKNSFEKYSETCGVKIDIDKIKQSIKLIMDSPADYEFRITAVPRFHTKEDFEGISKAVFGAKKFFIQNFKSASGLIDETLKKEKPFTKPELEEFKRILEKTVSKVELRNV